jgi:hypothetical protein
MKTIICILSLSLIFSSCAPKIFPVTGKYPETPIIIKSNKSFDQAWDKLVDIFAQKGLSIKIIDRSSGLIISSKSELPTTFEDKNGIIVDPAAFIVAPSTVFYGTKRGPVTGIISGANAKKTITSPAYGDWNVRLKPDGTGCLINVNINNVNYTDYADKLGRSRDLNSFKTTGVFENTLAKMINE